MTEKVTSSEFAIKNAVRNFVRYGADTEGLLFNGKPIQITMEGLFIPKQKGYKVFTNVSEYKDFQRYYKKYAKNIQN